MTHDGNWQRDAELLQRWREGDDKAGASLYDRHCKAVLRLFQNKVPDQAEELMQETFLALVKNRDRIREGVSVRAFVLKVAHHKLIDHLRKLGRTRAMEVDESVQTVAALVPGPSSILAQKREQKLLLDALRRLPIEQQIAIELYYWEGLKANDIAVVFEVSHSAMRSRLVKARRSLEQMIAELAASPEERESTLTGLDTWAAQIRAKALA